MTKEEKAAIVMRQDGKVFDVGNIQITTQHLSSNYVLNVESPAELKPGGLLKVFELKPLSNFGPAFHARWDGGSREPGKTERCDLDIDILGVSSAELEQFKQGKNGY